MLVDKVRSEMIAALKAGEKEKKETLSMLVSALDLKAKDKRSALTVEEEIAVVQRELKQTKETLDSSPKDRRDIIEKCTNRINVIEVFLPTQMGEDELKGIISDVIAKLGITSVNKSDKGKIMKELMPLVKGKADGKLVNTIVESFFE